MLSLFFTCEAAADETEHKRVIRSECAGQTHCPCSPCTLKSFQPDIDPLPLFGEPQACSATSTLLSFNADQGETHRSVP